MTETEPLSIPLDPTCLFAKFAFRGVPPSFGPSSISICLPLAIAVAVDEVPVRLLVVLLPGHALALPHRASRHPQRCRHRPGGCARRCRPLGRCQRRWHRFWNRQRGLSREVRRTRRGHSRGGLHVKPFRSFGWPRGEIMRTFVILKSITFCVLTCLQVHSLSCVPIFIFAVILSGVYLRPPFGIGGRHGAGLFGPPARPTGRHIRADHRRRLRPLPDVPGTRLGPHRGLVPLHDGATRTGVQEGLRIQRSHGRTHLEVFRRRDGRSLESKVVQSLRAHGQDRREETAIAVR